MVNNVLIVEDDPITLKILASALEKYNFHAIKAVNGSDALSSLNKYKIRAVILDINLPDINGMEILKYIRSHEPYKSIAVLVVTNNDDKTDMVLGLEMGADDYITKPFHQRELIARLNTVLRRTNLSPEKPDSPLVFNDLQIYIERRLVKKGDELINLSFKEFDILLLLAENAGKVISRETILNEIGGNEYTPETRTVDMHIASIRKKLGDTGKQKKYIDTVSGIGYKFRE